MKKSILSLIACSAFVSLFISKANAQEFTTAKLAGRDEAPVYASKESSSRSILTGKSGNRAFKNFSKQFKNVPDADWFITKDDGFAAMFTENGRHNTAVFSSNGSFVYSITRHSNSQLPQNLVKDVELSFDGYKVICGEEIWVDGKTIYLVHIQSYTKCKTIRVADDGMEVIEELIRS